MTRIEYLVEVAGNWTNKIVSVLNQRENPNKEEINKMNLKGFLYQCGRISPLEYLCELARILTEDEWNQVKKEVKDDTKNDI